MKKLYLLVTLIVVYSFLAVAMNHRISKEKMEGKWEVKVANAPSGYRDYVVEIKEKEGVFKAEILFVDTKEKISNQTLTQKGGKLSGNLYVDNEKVDVAIWEEKGIVQGIAKSPSMGTLSMTFTRLKG